MSEPIAKIVRESKVIVCCGAGGVGKTTTSGALAVAGARMGRKVLVLTIDPSKRLAETLGVARNPPEPVSLDAARLKGVGVNGAGSLDAWMLDPRRVADDAVRRIVMNPEDVEKLFKNRIYQHVTQMVAGVHEYMAMQALHRFVLEGRYDLVVLDTPPSRHALDFLEAPGRMARFLDGRIFKMFMPAEAPKGLGKIKSAASSLVGRVLNGVLGEQFAGDLSTFFGVFSGVLTGIMRDVNGMRGFLGGPEVSFVLVSSPSPAALEEARFFQAKTRELELPLRGFILNKSYAREEGKVAPGEAPSGAAPALRSALVKLTQLADAERAAARHDRQLLEELKAQMGTGGFVTALPILGHVEDELANLAAISDLLVN